MPSNIAKPNASTAVTSAVKPSPVAKPKPATIPSSTPGGLGVKPVKNKVPVRFSVNNVDDHDRTRLARPSKPKYEVGRTNVGLPFALLIHHLTAYC